MSDDAGFDLGPHAWKLDHHLQGRTLGLIAFDLPGDQALRGRAWTSASAHNSDRSLGSLVLATRDRASRCGVNVEVAPQSTLLLLGPVGDDHGRVKGTMRALGARLAQSRAMLKPYDVGTIATIGLGSRVRRAVEASVEPFDATKLNLYCASLREQPVVPGGALEVLNSPSFFNRWPTAWHISTPATASCDDHR